MVTLLVILHVVVCLFLIGVVLLQQGKSTDVAAAFGGQGGTQTAFGPRGAANLFTRLTTWSAIIFMLTSISLTIVLSRSNTSAPKSVFSGEQTQSTPAKK